jgi:hypothetical protein
MAFWKCPREISGLRYVRVLGSALQINEAWNTWNVTREKRLNCPSSRIIRLPLINPRQTIILDHVINKLCMLGKVATLALARAKKWTCSRPWSPWARKSL